MPDSGPISPGLTAHPMRRRPSRAGIKHVSVALQGGGSHGAFAWGVMHRLISEPRLYIDGLSGTSAGAMNAVVFADGFIKGSRQGAINGLAEFWGRVAERCTLPRSPMAQMFGVANPWQVDAEPAFMMLDFMTRIWSPSQLNPSNKNPLRDILLDIVDFDGLREREDVKLFITASNVRTCKSRVFRTPELSVDALLASACLPLVTAAVEIDGEHYWDGGYLGNPAIHPLINECASSDVVIIQINPLNRPDVPVTMRDILDRINEMTFNASLVREMAGIANISGLVESGALDDERYNTVRFHEISAEAELAQFGALSKMNTERGFLEHLHDLGYETADKWVVESFDRIGWESTVDVREKYT
jgi:NTE family protein